MALQELAYLAFRQRTGKTIHRLAAFEQHHGGYVANAEHAGQFALRLDVDLAQAKRTVVFVGELFQDRSDGLARFAPGGPEIQQYRRSHGFLHDFGFERLVSDVKYGRHGGSFSHG